MSARRLAALVAAMAVLVAAACSPGVSDEVRSSAPYRPADVVDAGRASPALWSFAADLHRALAAAAPGENLVVAPVPVVLGLAQARAGARGATADQLTTALHADHPDFGRGLDAARRSLEERSGERTDPDTGRRGRMAVELASALWAPRDTGFEPAWLDTLATTWGAGIRVTDFRSDPEAARRTVNSWVADSTGGQISDVLDRGTLDQLTRFLATSAAYLKAPWLSPFDTSDTRLGEFRQLDGAVVTVPVMRRLDPAARYGTGDGWVAVELPYLDSRLTFTAVLPDEGRFLEVERSLDGPALEALRRGLRRRALDLTLPEFGFTTDVRLDDALRALGVVDAFDRSVADFSGITDDEPLAFWAVVHESYLGVDEQGTEATATSPRPTTTTTTATPTAPGTGTASGSPAPERMVVDRPFLVLVTDRVSGAPLFYARVMSPRG